MLRGLPARVGLSSRRYHAPSKTGVGLRILLLSHNLAGLGGSYMRSFSLARQLAGFGHSVHLLASRRAVGVRPVTTICDKVKVVEMPDITPARFRNGGLSPLDTLARMSWISRRSFDVIHAFDHRPAVSFPALVGRNRGALLVCDWADLWGKDGIASERGSVGGRLVGAGDDYWEPRFRRSADGLSAISRALWDRAGGLGIPEERRMILPAGANVDLIRPLAKSVGRSHYDLPQDAHIVVSTGFAPYDEDLLAETMVEILSLDLNAWAVTSGARSPRLQRAVGRRGLHARLRMLGSVPLADLERVLACADVLLLPYSRKLVNLARFPNRFGDYLAAGRAIVTNRTGDLGELVARHQLGVLAEENPVDMARKVVDLFKDRQRGDELGRRARTFAEDHLNWTTLAKGVERFYGDLLTVHRH